MAHKPNSARGDWAKQVRFDMAFAEKRLVQHGGVGRMFVVHCKDTLYAMPAPWESADEKADMIKMVRAYCIAHDAQALSFISEAWIRHLHQAPGETEEEFQARIDAVRPRDAEDRREVVMVMTMFRDEGGQRQILSDTREIQRRANGKPEGLTPYRLNRGVDIIGGGVVEAFPEWQPSPEHRLLARMALGIQ
jgi:hypothetical protein